MLLPMLLSVMLPAVPHEVRDADYRVELPAPLAAHYERIVQTPWGRAHVDEYLTRDERGITFIFSAYRYRSAAPLKVAGLRAAKDNFLLQHKCVATTLDAAPIHTADAAAWPQTTFGGTCAAPGDYRILVLIAAGRHYQLQVSNDPQPLSPASVDHSATPERRDRGTQDLEQALREFAGHCRFDTKTGP